MKKFKDWITEKKDEVKHMLFPTLMNEDMLKQQHYTLKNGEDITVRIANEDDLEDIIAIQKACYAGKAPWGRIAVSSELRNKSTAFFLICHYYGEPVSFIGMSLRRESLHVTNIATMPAYQKQGVGTFLIKMCADIGQKLNRKVMTLEVRTSNENAKHLYRKIGFTDGRLKRNYYQNNGEDALEMAYKIDEVDEYNNAQSVK